MINVAKVTTVPKMSSESRTSGDGEAKEIEQDQTTTVSGESGSSVSEGRTSDADVKAEKAVSKENETLETSKPSEEHSVLQSRSSTDERDLNAPHTEGEATPVEKKESDEPSRIVDHTKDSTRDKEVTPPDKSAENTKEVSLSSESEHVDNRKVEPGLTADPETERQDDAHTEGTDPSDVVVDDNKPPESSNDGTATGGVGSSVPNSEQPEELQSPHIDDPSSSAGTQEGSSVSHQDVGKDSPERKKEQLLQEETATEVASEQAQATVDSSAVPGVPTASKQDKEDLQMERDSKAAKQEMTADTNDTTSDDFTEAKPKDETEEPGKGEKRDGEDPAKGKLQPDDEPPPTDGQKSSSEGVVGDKEEKLNEGAPKDGEEPTVNKTSKEEDNSSSQESTKAASKDSDPGKGDHTDTPVQEESPPSVKQETTAPVQTTEKTITEPATDAHKTETSTKVTSEGQDNKGETTDTPEEERILPDDFFYDYEKLRSKPESVDVSMDILKLHHSFGFECQKRSNLIALDKDVIAFAAGNFVNIINLETGEHTYLRSLSGGGIGAIAVHPSSEYFAVGEKGTHPHIAIYTYPDLKLHRLLREGTEEMYSHMAFSPKDGALLASVGGNPDYMLTVWDWKKESIVLRSKAFSQDIYRVSFSPDLEGQLTTSGTGHIRFWKMARTFTGLKLQGQLGKFGRTELTDIAAYVELPDGKVLSGTEWGNLLLWDGGFIKVEIAKKGKKTCHNGTIEAMFLEEGELITAGADGYVKVWDYETIDNADITEDNTQFEMEPLTEIRVGTKVSIKSLVRCADPEMTTMWYAQDANGVIWNVDVIDSHMRKPPEKLLHFPSGAITGLGVSSKDYLTGVLAEDGSVTVFNYSTKERVCMSKFTGGGGALLWAPDQIDAESKTLVAGFGDGVVRVLVMEESDPRQVSAGRRLSPKLVLAHVCKPHTKTVTAFAVDPSGDLLATGSEDSTVFFLSVKEAYDPIGFIQTPSPVTSMMWSHHDNQDELKLLVCCEDGSMIEVDAPKKGVFDTSRTYFLDPLKFSCRTFQTVKDKIKKAEEDARIAAEKEKKRKEREERLAKKREEEGEEAELSDEEEEEPEPEEVHEEEEEKQKGPSPILKGFYYGPDRDFWLSMGGYDAGFLYQCSLTDTEPGGPAVPYEPKTSIPLPTIAGRDMPLTAIAISNTGQYMLVGSDNGAVRVFPLTEGNSQEFKLDDFCSHWTFNIHDNHYGHVTHICCSHDDKYVITAGSDGNLFVFQASLEAKPKKKEVLHQGDIKSVLDLASEVKDIEDPNAYSIEDAKQKAEHDRRMKAAEEKKQSMRHEILGLRKQFQQLVHKADSLPENLKLPKEEFVMDPDMESTMKAQLQEKITTVHREMAWEAEKCVLLRKKLEMRFKAVVQTEHIVVKAIGSEASVASYRTPIPSKEYMAMMKDYQELVSSRPTTTDTFSTRPATTAVGLKELEDTMKQEVPVGVTPKQQHMSRAAEKAEARRARRIARQKQWADLMETRPNEKYEDPSDLATFRRAERTIGDFKLKSGSDYVVPEDQRVTATKKRHELLVLRNEILTRKANFNTCLLALRDRKKQIVDKIKVLTASLEEAQSHLPPEMHKDIPPVPTMDLEEIPEQEFEFTSESLMVFKDELAARKEAESKAKSGGGDDFGGFGGFGGGGGGTQPPDDGDKKKEEEPPPEQEEQTEEEGAVEEQDEEPVAPEEEGEESVRSGEGSTVSVQEETVEILSPLERKLEQEQLIRWTYECDHLLEEIARLKDDFDKDLLWLRHEKGLQDILMKMADLRHINLFKELELLKEFEKRESTYTTRYTSKKNERKEMDTKIKQCQQQVQVKETEVSRLHEEEKALEASFLEQVGESKFREFLVKIFKKKIKRAKKKEEEGAGSDDEESDEDDSDSEWMSSSEEEDDEEEGKLDDTVCPEGCEEALFDLAIQLREKRMDYEEGLAESKKHLDLAKKEVESLKKKYKILESGVKTAHNELQAFQLEKQQKLNELDQVVVLRFSQIMYYGRGPTPPTNLSSCLVFSASERHRLQNRISELHQEKQQEAKNFSEIKQKHVKLARDKKMMLAKVRELQDKVDQAMMLKFGRVVDLDRLDDVHVNKTADELRLKIEGVEKRAVKSLAEIDEKIEREKTRYLEILRDNTRRLSKVSELQKVRKDLEKRLNMRQKTMAAPYNGEFLDSVERERLTGLVDYQVQEVEMLKEEIRMLQLKGGHVLPPSQPPMPSSGPHHH